MNSPFYFSNRREWRSWLVEHHSSEKEVWLAYYKKHTGKATVTYNEAVEEAICFGWIDSIVKTIDEESYMQKYTPRRKKSIWSKLNRTRAEKMIQSGRMTSAGMALIEEAKKSGKWREAFSETPEPEMPEEMKEILLSDGQAWNNFSALAPSHKKMYISWVCQAKRHDTRAKRIAEVFRRTKNNEKPGMM